MLENKQIRSIVASYVGENKEFARQYLIGAIERALPADFAIVRAWKGDRHGNLLFPKAARNFNRVCAMAGKVAIAEVEHLGEPGDLDPDARCPLNPCASRGVRQGPNRRFSPAGALVKHRGDTEWPAF